MASAYLMLISVLLAVSQSQGQCPLDSCSLVTQVNICTNETASSGGCSDSCIMALRGSSTVDECCSRIEQSTTNAPTSGQNGGVCGEEGAQTQFGHRLDIVNGTRQILLASDIHEGTYVVLQRNFMYSCSGCVKSIQLAVSPTSDFQMHERIKFHTFANRTGDKSTFQNTEDVAEWTSSVVLMRQDRHIVEYRPLGSSEVCFSQGDVFGFTIETGSGVTLLNRFASESDAFVLNASSTVQTISGCPQLSDNGLYTTAGSFSGIPLIHIVTGGLPPTEPSLTTTEPPSTEPITQADTKTAPDSATTSPNPSPTDPKTGYVIYAVNGFAGAICVLFIVVTIVVVLVCISRHRHNRITQYKETYNLGNSISLDSNAAYGVSNLFEDGDHMDRNEAYGNSNPIGVGDHMESNEAYGISIHVGVGDHMENNASYGVLLQQTGTPQESEDDTPHMYDYPMVDLNNVETKANEAYGTAMVQQ